MQSLLILGRQPELGLAELESLYGADKIQPLTQEVALVDIDACTIDFKRLGGSLRLATLLSVVDTEKWPDVVTYLTTTAPEQSKKMPAGKMTLGFSLYNFNLSPRLLSKDSLVIKRAITQTGRSVRIVPSKNLQLNTAQVIHNKLTSERAWELLIVRVKDQTYIGRTVMVQDIEAYAKRDQARPFRDSRVGMLPPKLAQIIINLAVGKLSGAQLQSACEPAPNREGYDQTILDPFCGTGVILQEALLMGYDIAGSDINPKMVEYSKSNLDWLAKKLNLSLNNLNVTIADAAKHHWDNLDFVASETNLGRPLTQVPSEPDFSQLVKDADRLITDFLKNIAVQTKPGQRLCLAVPAWQTAKDNFRHLPLIDHLSDIGYNQLDFKHRSGQSLIYYRPDQIVARELLTLVRK